MPWSLLEGLAFPLQLTLLTGIGLIAGAFSNWAIYSWTWFLKRSVSPWQAPHPEATARQWRDYLPVIGWPGRARDEAWLGKRFWLRPMLIELGAAILMPVFYFWLLNGGLLDPIHNYQPDHAAAAKWFLLLAPFVTLLVIGTFIDFDEHIIPDGVTLPGTLWALVIAALVPASRLPEWAGKLSAWNHVSIDYLSPNRNELALFDKSFVTLALLLGIFAVWIWALLPKFSPFDVGWWRSIKLMGATIFRPRRRRPCAVRVTTRTMPIQSKVLLGMLALGWAGILASWQWLDQAGWESLTGSLLGLAFGGGMIWSIRIVGTTAMGRQAMGFGDVTLMAMIGATLGWQATLLAFVFTIVLIVVFLVIQILVTGSQELAFGPYLCGGAVTLLYFWASAWAYASGPTGIFSMGIWLVYLLVAFPIMMFIMLFGLQVVKATMGRE